jgi:DNA-binding NarL/FixJ family response regulator
VSRFDKLSPRETAVARLLAVGTSRNGIAKLLEMSPKTVDTHRAKVLRKLGAANAVVLARMALADHFVPPLRMAPSDVERVVTDVDNLDEVA